MRRKRSWAVLVAGLVLASISFAAPPVVAGPEPHIKGSGWVGIGNPNDKAHFRAQLACSPTPDGPAIFEWSWGENHFSLDRMESAGCTNNLDDEGRLLESVHQGSGVGTCGEEGAFIIDWRLVDGAMGRGPEGDRIEVTIGNPDTRCHLAVSGPLGGGNVKMWGDPEE